MKQAQADDQRHKLAIYGSPVSHSVSPLCFRAIFESLGLPKHTYDAVECEAITGETSAWHTNVARPETIGTCLTMPLKLHVIPFLDELTDRAQSIGGVNTTVLVDQPDGSVKHIGDNTDPSGISGVLLSAFTGHESPVDERTPSSFRNGTVAGVIIGSGGAARSAIYALDQMAVSPILITNRDEEEAQALIRHFPRIDLRYLANVQEANDVATKLREQGRPLCVGVGAVPSDVPQTTTERAVYDIAEALFAQHQPEEEHNGKASVQLQIPKRPVFLDMAYKPRMTPLRKTAESHGWTSLCGVDVVAELCFVQAEIWLGRSVPAEARTEIRELLRKEA